MPALPPLVMDAVNAFIVGFIVLNVVIGMVTYVTLLERKFAARMQSRIGPYRVGPHGLLQPIADAIKLMMKEDVVPTAALFTIWRRSCSCFRACSSLPPSRLRPVSVWRI